jgi:Peptidase inhibitor I9
MRLFSFITLAILVPAFVAAVPAPGPPQRGIRKFSGPKKDRGYIVKLKPGVSKTQLANKLNIPVKAIPTDLPIINGFSGTLDQDVATKLAGADEVEYVVEDGYAKSTATAIQ